METDSKLRNVKSKSRLPVREVPGTNLDQKNVYREIFRDFQADAETAPQIRGLPLSSPSLLPHYCLTSPLFGAM